MTVRHLKIFLEVYRNGSITRASERLHMTQPAVTRAIQELEHYYGVRLFDRINRRLLVTEAGKQLYAQALHLVDLFEHMETSLRNWDALGVLRIGSSIALGTHVLPDLILRFRADHPALRTQVTIQNQFCIRQRIVVDEPVQFRPLKTTIGHLILNSGTVNGNHAAVRIFQFHTGGVDIKLTGNQLFHGMYLQNLMFWK